MARSSYRTLLSLDGYARLLGLDPVHFGGAVGGTFWPDHGACEDIWRQHPWQTPEDFISREELALAIYNAEKDMEAVLGYSIAPKFVNEEVVSYPRHYRRDWFATGFRDTRWGNKVVKTHLGKLLCTGRRATTLLSGGATVAYGDADGDSWNETATITFADDTTDLDEIKVYFVDKAADPAWEIRPRRSITRASGTVTIKLDSWLLINPVLWERHPQSNERPAPIDISTTANFVSTVDVYREYVNTAMASAQLFWDPIPGNNDNESQDGYLSVSDPELGFVSPFAASYTADGWITVEPSVGREPDQVRIWYYAGALSEEYLAGYTLDPLSDYFATTVMWLATARLSKTLCSCSHAQRTAAELQRDMTQITKNSTFVLNLATDLFTNPLGTKVGEYRAWQRLARLTDDYVNIGGVA